MDLLSVHDKTVLDTIFDPLQPLGLGVLPEENFEQDDVEDEKLTENVTKLVKEAIACVEGQRFEDAFRLFDEAMDQAPHSPTVLNDRAQALRLASRNAEALKDLETAVKFSGGCGKSGIQALCQRGVLYHYYGRDDEARKDFSKAAKAGSRFARTQLAALNPYAAMCNAMLQKITVSSN